MRQKVSRGMIKVTDAVLNMAVLPVLKLLVLSEAVNAVGGGARLGLGENSGFLSPALQGPKVLVVVKLVPEEGQEEDGLMDPVPLGADVFDMGDVGGFNDAMAAMPSIGCSLIGAQSDVTGRCLLTVLNSIKLRFEKKHNQLGDIKDVLWSGHLGNGGGVFQLLCNPCPNQPFFTASCPNDALSYCNTGSVVVVNSTKALLAHASDRLQQKSTEAVATSLGEQI